MCVAGPDAVFAVYSNDEGPGETVGAGYGVEEGVRVAGLGVCADRIVKAYAKLNTLRNSAKLMHFRPSLPYGVY